MKTTTATLALLLGAVALMALVGGAHAQLWPHDIFEDMREMRARMDHMWHHAAGRAGALGDRAWRGAQALGADAFDRANRIGDRAWRGAQDAFEHANRLGRAAHDGALGAARHARSYGATLFDDMAARLAALESRLAGDGAAAVADAPHHEHAARSVAVHDHAGDAHAADDKQPQQQQQQQQQAVASSAWRPAVDIAESDDGASIVVHAELPGVELKDVEVSIDENNVLTLRGKRVKYAEHRARNVHWEERHEGSFSRAFVLPPSADASAAAASFQNGVLTITVPKSAARPAVTAVPVSQPAMSIAEEPLDESAQAVDEGAAEVIA